MNVPIPVEMCERCIMNAMGRLPCPSGLLAYGLQLIAAALTTFSAVAETADVPANTNAPVATASVHSASDTAPKVAETVPASVSGSSSFDESAFRIIPERNIFNANRSGGQVRLSSSRRPTRVDSFTLVGTLAYEKGAFAFFDGSSSEFSKAVKTGGVIAGYKVVDVLANAVKLEGDGKVTEVPIGSAMRREEEGAWHMGDAVVGTGGSSYASNRGDSGGHSSSYTRRDSGFVSATRSTMTNSNSKNDHSEDADQLAKSEEKQAKKELKKELKMDSKMESEVLKRLLERREQESQ